MTPVKCVSRPDEHGDCWRACIASVLDLPALEVPNFAQEFPGWDEMLAAARQWLRQRGLTIFRTYCSAKWERDRMLEVFSSDNPGTPIILIGESGQDSGDNHAVVVIDGSVDHDPSGAGVVGPVTHGGHERGWWWFDVIAVASTPAEAASA